MNETKLKKLSKTKQKTFLEKYIKKFNTKKISFPISIADIKRFLNQNEDLKLKINILYNVGSEIYPYEYGIGSGEKTVNLLMVQKTLDKVHGLNHFLLITNPDKFLRRVYRTENGVSYRHLSYCLNCLNSFSSPEVLSQHQRLCCMNKPRKETLPLPDGKKKILKFRNYENTHMKEYVAYLDFECVLPKARTSCANCTTFRCKCDNSFTDVLTNQEPIAYSFFILQGNDIIHRNVYVGENAGDHFMEHLMSIEERMSDLLSEQKDLIMTKSDNENFSNATHCYMCEIPFEGSTIKNRDHSHMSGQYLGAACTACNLRRRRPKRLKIFIHNGSRYDFHFLVKSLEKYDDISEIRVLPFNGENFRTISFKCFEFNDSLSFLQASLSQLTDDLHSSNHKYPILKSTNLVKTNGVFDKKKFKMLLKKSFFPYELCTSLEKMVSTTSFPKQKHFFSSLSETSISEENHKFAKSVWKTFKCKNLVDYVKVYCELDTLLLAEVFQKFRSSMHAFSGLDPSHYISLPSYSFDSMLKLTDCKIELITEPNIDMIHFIENGIRGGMAFIGTRKLEIEDPEKEEILYLDANVSFQPLGLKPMTLSLEFEYYH